MSPTDVLAHGVGGRQDLPLPFSFALAGAAAAVAVSFVATALLWRTPRLRGQRTGSPIPAGVQRFADSPATRSVIRAIGLTTTVFVALAALLGPNDETNPAAGLVYVVFWVGLVPASLLFGPVWRLLNPIRTIHRGLATLAGTDPEHGVRPYPRRLGYWPAASGLFAFTWLELVAPGRTSSATLLLWFAGYAAVQLLGAMVFGSGWFARGDAFEVYSDLIGRLSPLGRREDGRLVLRNPLVGLDVLRPAPGLVAVVCVLLGSTAYDGFSNAPVWVQATQTSGLSAPVSGTLGLTGMVLLVAGVFAACTTMAGSTGETRLRHVPSVLAHSVVPIAVGYLVAHYFSLLLFEGQRTLILASDPFGAGTDLFGTAEWQVNFSLATPAAIAIVQVVAVVLGHVLGVVAAHDRAVGLFPVRRAVVGQLPLVVLMIGYTVGGLTLLFAA